MKEMHSRGRTRRLASRLWIILGLALVVLLLFLLIPRGQAIAGRRVFGGVLIVSPPQPGDRHHISESQARAVLDNQVFLNHQEKLILFGFGRFTAPSINVTSPVVHGPAWIGIFHTPASALFFGCSANPPPGPVPPKPPDDAYFAIVIDPNRGTHTLWQGDNSAYMAWACATGRNKL